jgi:hypothetical protein
MRSLGRGLQLLGLVVPPLGIFLQLSETISLGQMLTMLVAAVSSFWIGRLRERLRLWDGCAPTHDYLRKLLTVFHPTRTLPGGQSRSLHAGAFSKLNCSTSQCPVRK